MNTEVTIDFANSIFLESSKVNAVANRLNWRSDVLIRRNASAFRNKRVLDLASHDGRFSYAALACGASHVVGVEARGSHVESAKINLRTMWPHESGYDFVVADLVDFLRSAEKGQFDTILCFGIFSHLVEQVEILREIARIGPSCFILDTWVARPKLTLMERWRNYGVNQHVARTQLGRRANGSKLKNISGAIKAVLSDRRYRTGSLVFLYENADAEGSTIRESGLMAWPTPSLVEMLFEHYGYEYRAVDWAAQGIADWAGIEDYKRKDRFSWIASCLKG